MNLAQWLTRTARRVPNAPALLYGDGIVADYARFARRVACLAGALRQRFGIGPDTRVAMVMPNRLDYLELMYAVWFAGSAVVPINSKLHAKEAAWIIENAQAKVVFVADAAANELARLLEGCVAAMIAVESKEFAGLYAAEPLASPV